MEISDLTAQFVQNYDRILAGNAEKADYEWKINAILANDEKSLIQLPSGSTALPQNALMQVLEQNKEESHLINLQQVRQGRATAAQQAAKPTRSSL